MDEPQVTFQEEVYTSVRQQRNVNRIGIVSRAVIALGLAEDDKQAQTVLLYIAIIAILLAGVVFFGLTPKSQFHPLPPAVPAS